MYRVTRLTQNDRRRAAVIPVESIIGSVHLLPRFGPIIPPHWNSFSVLDQSVERGLVLPCHMRRGR
jgi:hypothetical protein